MKKETIMLSVITISIFLVVILGASFAYFTASIGGTGNNTNNTTKVTMTSLGSIKYTGETIFNETDIYPGYKNIQTFTIEKDSQRGIGTYEIDLEGVVPAELSMFVEITLYKTTDPANNKIEREEGSLTLNDDEITKEDRLTITGNPEIIYGPSILLNNKQIVLEQQDFDTNTLDKTTYYLVYSYRNYNFEQDEQQGKVFSGKVTVKLINQLFSKEIVACGKDGKTATTCLLENASKDPINLAYDNTIDNNLRYIGTNPNNYVDIGDTYGSDIYYGYDKGYPSSYFREYNSLSACQSSIEFNTNCTKMHLKGKPILWRIIGVMNNVEDGSGTKASRLKLIRDQSIGDYSWDNKASGTGSSTSVNGSNDWSDSTLQEVLNNGAYYNQTSGTCPYGSNGANMVCDFTSNGLTPEAKTMIENVKWSLGGISSALPSSLEKPSNQMENEWYNKERGTEVYEGRPTEWIGKVGLMYPSDYGYATSGGETTNREACLAKELFNWDATEVSDCKNNDWLYNSSNWQWTLSPNSGNSYIVFDVYDAGYVSYGGDAGDTSGVSPAVYLLSETKISSGNGTKLAPYTLTVG